MNDKTFAEMDLEGLTQVSGGCHGTASYAGAMGGELSMGEMGLGSWDARGGLAISDGSTGSESVNPYDGYGMGAPSFDGALACVGQVPSSMPNMGNLAIGSSPQGAMGTQNLMSFVNSPAFYQAIASPSTWSNAAASLVRPGNDASLGQSPQMFIGGPQTRIA